MSTTMMTTDVEARVCLGVGHVTFLSSTFEPARNSLNFSITTFTLSIRHPLISLSGSY